MTNKKNTFARGAILIAGAFIVTLCVAAFIITLAITILQNAHSCSVMSRALLVLWVTIAALFLTSVIVTGVLARKLIPNLTGRRITVAIHGVAMLACYVVIAFILLVAFNC